MRFRRCFLLLVVLCSAAAWAQSHASASSSHKSVPARMPVTTSSIKARGHFEKAMQCLEEVRLADSVDQLRAATRDDAKFAQAWILLSYLSHDPEEQDSARNRAKQLAPSATRGEHLLIQWLSNAAEDKYVPAIAAMNDLVALYPKDQLLLYIAGGWLSRQTRYTQSIGILERAVALDPNYAAALNELAYEYAFTGDFSKAFALMERYVALEPDQPNPHDSYAEILRMAGKFDAALEQYRQSIRIDPQFGSELGVADTYALMGKEEEARDEYTRAVVFARSDDERIQYELNSAVTWIRENNRKQAERALREVARHAHVAGLGRLEAEAHRVLSMYEPEYKAACKELDSAQKALDEPHQLSRIERDEEHARILMVRTIRAMEAHADETATSASQELQKMARESRSQVIQLASHTSAGAMLMGASKNAEAIPELEEDSDNPLALRLLWEAHTSVGNTTKAEAIANKLAAMNVPTAEQALVVPQFRSHLISEAQRP